MSNTEFPEMPTLPAEVTTVYTKPECPDCTRTKAFLDRKGIPYETVDMIDTPGVMEAIKEMGYSQAPVVITERPGEEAIHWAGMSRYELMRLERRHLEDKAA